MKSRSRWFLYIILNIIISASVTGAVLYFYDRYQRTLETPTIASILPVTPDVQVGEESFNLEIVEVIGAGVAETEIAILQNKGENPVELTGWIIKNGEDESYIFPQVKMFKDGRLQLHTSAGANTPVDLYWGRSQSAWQSGGTVSLWDAQGTLQATYVIP
jgi:hypothetical protein